MFYTKKSCIKLMLLKKKPQIFNTIFEKKN